MCSALGALRLLLKTLQLALLCFGVALLSYQALLLQEYRTRAGQEAPVPWFVWAASSVSALVALTGASGLASSTTDAPRCCFGAHATFTTTLLLLQVALLLALWLAPDAPQPPRRDDSGELPALVRFVGAHRQQTTAALLAGALLTLLALTLSCVLSALTRQEEDEEDEEEAQPRARAAAQTAALQEPLLSDSALSYSQLARSRYAAADSSAADSPARPRRLSQHALLRAQREEQEARSCLLM